MATSSKTFRKIETRRTRRILNSTKDETLPLKFGPRLHHLHWSGGLTRHDLRAHAVENAAAE